MRMTSPNCNDLYQAPDRGKFGEEARYITLQVRMCNIAQLMLNKGARLLVLQQTKALSVAPLGHDPYRDLIITKIVRHPITRIIMRLSAIISDLLCSLELAIFLTSNTIRYYKFDLV
jgi:hypothetical protein